MPSQPKKLRLYCSAPKYTFGDYEEALKLDKMRGNTKWEDCTALEMLQLDEYKTFGDLGHSKNTRIPVEYKKIKVHLVYGVKHNGRHKARLVADGHLTEEPLDSVYSGVVSLQGI